MSQLSKRLIVLCAIVLVVLGSVLTITLRKDRRQVVEEILTVKAPKLAGDPRLKQLSAIIAEEIEKTDEHRQDRVDDLLVAMEESEELRSLESIGELGELRVELVQENLKSLTKWFLSTDPPSPEQRRQIEGQIDEIVSFTKDFVLDMFPDSAAQIEEKSIQLRSQLIEEYDTPLSPAFKRPLSVGELEKIREQLVVKQERIENTPFPLPRPSRTFINGFGESTNPLLKEQANLWKREFAIGLLFTVPDVLGETYHLSPTEKSVQLSNELHAEFSRQAQVRAVESLRSDRIKFARINEKIKKELADRDAQAMAQQSGDDRHDTVGEIYIDENDDSGRSLSDFNLDGSVPPIPVPNAGDLLIPLGEKGRNDGVSNSFDAELRRAMEVFSALNLPEEDLPAFMEFYQQFLDDASRTTRSHPLEDRPDRIRKGDSPNRRVRERRELKEPPPTDFHEKKESERNK